LDLAPYSGFLNPVYQLKTYPCGTPADVLISYDEEYSDQMIRYGRDYGFLINK
jgi:dipeptidyl-peptidase III